jgi:thiol-disulfide isomerase/thioredoxin
MASGLVLHKKAAAKHCLRAEREKYASLMLFDKQSESYNAADAAAIRKIEKIESNSTYQAIAPIVGKARDLELKAIAPKPDAKNKAPAASSAVFSKDMVQAMKMVEDVKNMGVAQADEIHSLEADATEFLAMTKVAEYKYAVPSVDSTELEKLLKEKDTKVIVVFFAPWCPHCQNYVMHSADPSKDPSKAPLELFYKKHVETETGKKVKVVSYNVDADQDVPSQFKVPYIPAIFAADNESAHQFEGDATDFDSLVKFAVDKLQVK